jgi:hypothetical protein
MKYIVSYVESCTPDYFHGVNLPTVQVMLHSESTYGDILSDLKSYCTVDHLDVMDDGSQFNYELYLAALEDTFEPVMDKLDKVMEATRYIEPEPEDAADCYDSVYAYFVIQVDKEGDEDEL